MCWGLPLQRMAGIGQDGCSQAIEAGTGYMKRCTGMDSPTRHHRPTGDGLTLTDCYIGATVRCAPPGNKPAPDEFEHCRRFLRQELQLLKKTRVVIALGKIAFDHYLKTCRLEGLEIPSPAPLFGHGAAYRLSWGITLIGSYHPSQQNTFTGKLTRTMFHAVLAICLIPVLTEGAHKIDSNSHQSRRCSLDARSL
jgi:hypothetical protein